MTNTDRANELTMRMDQSKETKGTVVFTEVTKDPDQRPHTFYILKDAFAALGSPDSIIVDIAPITKS